MDVAQEIVRIIADYKDLEAEEVTPERSFEDLGIDSLDATDIIFEIEDKLDIDIPQDSLDLETMQTIGDILATVERVMGDGSGAQPVG